MFPVKVIVIVNVKIVGTDFMSVRLKQEILFGKYKFEYTVSVSDIHKVSPYKTT